MVRGPLYLIADSQLLFGPPARALAGLLGDPAGAAKLTATYLGASNGDAPAFFQLFRDAMAALGVTDVRHVRVPLDENDRDHLERADLVFLAGGDTVAGWAVLTEAQLDRVVRARHEAGAIVVGLSAGAVQLGRGYLGLVPAAVDVHAEPGWDAVAATVAAEGCRGLGVPRGGGLIVAADGSMRAIRRPAVELTRDGRRELVAHD